MAAVAGLDFDPVELLETELAADDRARRLRAVRGAAAVARACGADVARKRVLAVLAAHVKAGGEEDEVNFRLAQALDGKFLDLIGGDAHGHLLFAPLESLCRVEETMVRTRAAASLRSVLARASADDGAPGKALEVLSGLADPGAEATGFGAKCSAATLCAPTHAFLERSGAAEGLKSDARAAYARVAADDAPLVRRAAADELAAVCASVQAPEGFVRDLSETVTRLLEDEHDVVRLVAVEQLGDVLASGSAAAEAWSAAVKADLEAAESEGDGKEDPWYLAEPGARVVFSAHRDASWRVREAVAKSFAGYCQALAPVETPAGRDSDDLANGLLGMFAELFDDPEVEVRAAAFRSAVGVATVWPDSFAAHENALAAVRGGADAPELKVRLAAATALARLLGIFGDDGGSKSAAQASVFGTVEAKLFADEHVDVVLATLRELKAVVPALSDDPAGRVAALAEATVHDNWRVRSALHELLPAVAVARGRDAFEQQLLEGLVRAFQDRIAEVRSAAVRVLADLRDLEENGSPLFGGDWLMEKVGKRLSELYMTMSYYLYRVTIVQAFERLAHPQLAAEHMETIVLFLADCARDDVPNVRFTAVRALETVSAYAGDRLVASYVKPVLNELLANDGDDDVKFYVKRGIGAL